LVTKWTKETTIAELKRLYSENDKLSMWDIRTGFGRVKATGLYRAMGNLFGSIHKAIEASGLDYKELLKNSQQHRLAQVKVWTRGKVIADLKKLSKSHEYLSMWDIRTDFGRVKGTGLYLAMGTLFGSIHKAIEASGLDYKELLENSKQRQQVQRKVWTKEKVIAELNKLSKSHEDLTMWDIKTDFGRGKGTQLCKSMSSLFGSTENAIEASGMDYQLLLKNGQKRNSKIRTIWTKEKVIDELRKLYREHKELSLTDIKTDFGRVVGTRLYECMHKHFGSIRRAIDASGLDYERLYQNGLERRIKKFRKWSPEKIMSELQMLFNDNSDLSVRDIRTDFGKVKYSSLYTAMKYHFGGVKKAMKSSGLDYKLLKKNERKQPSTRKRKWTKARVIEELNRLSVTHESISMLELRTDFGKKVACSLYSAMSELFGTVKNAIDQSNLDYEELIANSEKGRIVKVRIWSKERVISELQTLDRKYRELSMWDIRTNFGRKETSNLYCAMKRYFGSIREAVDQSHLDYDALIAHTERICLNEKQVWSEKKIISELKRLYKSNYKLSLKDIRTDFGHVFSGCALYAAMSTYFGSPRRAIEESGLDYQELLHNRKISNYPISMSISDEVVSQ
jgi:hypothetical protein